MQLSPSLNIKQRQSLVMTPQLQQAIKLLQMTNLDLTQYLEEQTFDNPFLETEDDANAQKPDPIDNNKETSPEVPNKVEVDTSLENGSAIADDPTKHEDYDNRFDCSLVEYDGSSGQSGKGPGNDEQKENIIEATVADRPNSLYQHVENQILLIFDSTEEIFVAMKFLEHLEPSGWLEKSLDEIASECGIDSTMAEKILIKLQGCEPAGLFARNLKECLLIQAKTTNHNCESLEILLKNLELLAKGDFKMLAKKCGCDPVDITRYLKIIRSFNPKPGTMFENDLPHITSPDLIVKKAKDGWSVDLNKSTLPTVFVNESYAQEIGAKATIEKVNNNFASQALASARWLKRALEQRNTTTLKISAEIVRRQRDFLENGLDFLKPLSLKDVAEAVGMHESTVSRVTAGLLMNTPRGTFTLKSFFSVSIQSSSNGVGTSAAAVRHMIGKMISEETPTRPLSDDTIAKNISKRGVRLARRTVAKYREILHIPSSSERRRKAKMEMSLV
ncbi:MAG: RNA polymerase sigma-54 factor [Rhodobacteraceae bacterium]|nr:MAG: RNA polymerase sigma-54 factor [Paracoccaceae bacterium]